MTPPRSQSWRQSQIRKEVFGLQLFSPLWSPTAKNYLSHSRTHPPTNSGVSHLQKFKSQACWPIGSCSWQVGPLSNVCSGAYHIPIWYPGDQTGDFWAGNSWLFKIHTCESTQVYHHPTEAGHMYAARGYLWTQPGRFLTFSGSAVRPLVLASSFHVFQ